MSQSDSFSRSPSPFDDASDPISSIFPPPEAADADGLLAFGGALTPDLIVGTLVRGIFPWTLSLGEPPETDDFNVLDDSNDFNDVDVNIDFEPLAEESSETDFNDFNDSPAAVASALDVFSSLTPRNRDATWENFDASSLQTLEESNEILSWWSPNPRAILELDEFHVSRRLERTIRSGKFRVTFDEAFPETVLGCANAKNRATTEGTWISREFYAGYCRLFELGLAHSAECWLGDRLVGGVYGVAINGFFDGESMFGVERDASKVALTFLVRRLAERGFRLFDLQILNEHTASLGGREIPRIEYLRRLADALRAPVKFA